MKLRTHNYLFDIDVRHVVTDDKGHEKIVWERVLDVPGCNIDDVADRLHLNPDDVRYVHKTIAD